jgi:putative peptidoglycan lipid II flippase
MSEAMGPISNALHKLWSRPVLKDIITTTAFTFIGRSLGFVIPFLIAAWYGVGSETDAFFLSYGVIFFFTSILSGALSSVIVPFLAEGNANKKDIGKIIGSLLVASSFSVIIISVIFASCGYYFFELVTGFHETQLKLVYFISLETIPIILLVVLGNLLGGVLNAHGFFALPVLTFGLRSILTLIIIILLKDILGIHAIPMGYIVGELCRTIYLYYSVSHLNDIVIKLLLPDHESIPIIKKALIQMGGLAVEAFTPTINRIMTSWLALGSLSLFEYAQKLYLIPLSLCGEGIFIVLLSHWSTRTYTGHRESLKRDVTKTIKLLTAFSVPCTILLFVYKVQFVKLIYGWGVFPQDRIDELSTVFGMFILGIIPRLISLSFTRGLMVLKDTFSLAKIGVLKTFLTILVNLLLLKLMGLKGIALGSSLVEIFVAFFLWRFFNQTFEGSLEVRYLSPKINGLS